MRPFLVFRYVILVALLTAAPAFALITGSSTASMCGEGGNWIDITFTADEAVTLVDAWWDFTPTSVWLDRDGTSLCGPINNGVTSYGFYFVDPDDVDTQQWGLTATGFDSGDYFRFTMDLDVGGGGSPFTSNYYDGTVTVEFSDGTVLVGTFDTPYDSPSGATANFVETMPNLTFADRTGWYAPAVPRGDNAATWTSVPEPTTLVGETESTWFSTVCYNDGDATAMPTAMQLYVDGAYFCSHNLWTIEPGSYNGWVNDGAHVVRGGRHTVKVVADVFDAIDESDETDNVHARQWVWQPLTLSHGSPVTRAAPPPVDADIEYLEGYWWNCDGVRVDLVQDRPWNIVWMEPDYSVHRDYMMRVHPVATGPEDGFGYNLAQTSMPRDLQALLLNARNLAAPSYDIGVMNAVNYGTAPPYRIAHLGSSPYPFDFGVDPVSPYYASRAMSFEFDVDAPDLGAACLVARSDPEDGPVHMGWLAPDFAYGALDDVQDPVSTGDRGWAVLNLDLEQTGYHGVIVWADRLEHPSGLAVNVGLYHARPELYPSTLTGWYAPIVPRPDDDALLFSCPEPDTLHGNGPWTWLNTACFNGGAAAADTVSFLIELDGMGLVGTRSFTSLAAGLPRTVTNLYRPSTEMPWTVPGGRHTMGVEVDYFDDVAELIEVNNTTCRQYCWSPQVVPLGAVVERDAPPAQDGGFDPDAPDMTPYPNCDGLRLDEPTFPITNVWRGLAVASYNASTDLDLELHRPLQGTSDGFGPHVLLASEAEPGDVNFTLVNYREADATAYDVGVLRGNPSTANYNAEHAVSAFLGSEPFGDYGPFAINESRLLNLHEVYLAAGDLLVRLDEVAGGVDWGVAVYDASEAYFGKLDCLDDSLGDDGGVSEPEWIHVNVPSPGYYCVAVWKSRAGALDATGTYRLHFTTGATGAPDEMPTATRLVAASPNPFNPQTTLSYEMAANGHCELIVHDLAGRAVRHLVSADVPAGRHEAVFDGRDDRGQRLSSGVYLVRFTGGGVTDMQKLTLVK